MALVRPLFALAWIVVLAGCSSSAPPPELGGLWSAGPAACAAGVGVRFTEDAIEAVYETQTETLFARPHYAVESSGEDFRVRVRYELPHRPGGARSRGARGEVVLVRAGAGLAATGHNLLDARTGAARLRIADDPAIRALTLEPCGPHPWRANLRGLSAALPPETGAPAGGF